MGSVLDRTSSYTGPEDIQDFDVSKYISSKPKITLEHITPTLASWIILLTYVVFIVCFIFDMRAAYDTVNVNDTTKTLHGVICTDGKLPMNSCKNRFSCTSLSDDGTEATWFGHVGKIENIIAFRVALSAKNVTKDDIPNSNIAYNLKMKGLTEDDTCKLGFDDFSGRNVLQYDSSVNLHDYVKDAKLSVDLIDFTGQNEESIPSRSIIDSYSFRINYSTKNATDLDSFVPTLLGLDYKFVNLTRPLDTMTADVVNLIVMIFTLGFFVSYVSRLWRVLPDWRTWLPEQIFTISFFASLVFYQNPVYCVLNLYDDNQERPVAAFVGYTFDALGLSGLFCTWLFFADAFSAHFEQPLRFYGPKVLLCAILLTFNMILISLYFPALLGDEDRSALEAVLDWPKEEKVNFIVCAIALLVGACLWVATFTGYLMYSFFNLQRINYMQSRSLQLFFRFFLLEGWMITCYYVANYVVVFALFFGGGKNNESASQTEWNVEDTAESINILLKETLHLNGRVIFLTVYAIILAFLVSPVQDPTDTDKEGKALSVAFINYTISEEDVDNILNAKKSVLANLEDMVGVGKLLEGMVKIQPQLFCLETSERAAIAANLVYCDPKNVETESGLGKFPSDDIDTFEVLDFKYDPENECCCLILRDPRLKAIFVSFRGTCCRKHWMVNAQYNMEYPDMDSPALKALDGEDGLQAAVDEHMPRVKQLQLEMAENGGWSPFRTNAATKVRASASRDGMLGTVTAASNMVYKAAVGAGQGFAKGVSAAATVTIGLVDRSLELILQRKLGLHSGFWNMYANTTRTWMHKRLREIMTDNKMKDHRLIFAGHSLGGALANIAAVDYKTYSATRVECFAHKRALLSGDRPKRLRSWVSSHLNVLSRVDIYTFGSPRPGNSLYASTSDLLVPGNYRITVFGDIVTEIPPRNLGYQHTGIAVEIDPEGAGSILVDPGFLDKLLRRKITKIGVSKHSLVTYRRSLQGVTDAARFFIRQQHEEEKIGNIVSGRTTSRGDDALAAGTKSGSSAMNKSAQVSLAAERPISPTATGMFKKRRESQIMLLYKASKQALVISQRDAKLKELHESLIESSSPMHSSASPRENETEMTVGSAPAVVPALDAVSPPSLSLSLKFPGSGELEQGEASESVGFTAEAFERSITLGAEGTFDSEYFDAKRISSRTISRTTSRTTSYQESLSRPNSGMSRPNSGMSRPNSSGGANQSSLGEWVMSPITSLIRGSWGKSASEEKTSDMGSDMKE